MVRAAGPVSSFNDYNVVGPRLSDDKKWLWYDGGGWFSCSKLTFPFGIFIERQLLVGSSRGVQVPAPPQDEVEAPPPPSGSGGASREWVPGGGAAPMRIVCEVTDWYQYGFYVDTTIDYCWVE